MTGRAEWSMPGTRKRLSGDGLHELLREAFKKIPDHRDPRATIPLSDALMSAFAMFSLKDVSLLAFNNRRHDENLRALYRIGAVPSDTQMREILDGVDPLEMRPVFKAVFGELQRGKELEPFVFFENCYLLALDGTGYFSSDTIHCDSCQEKLHKATNKVTYEHQMLGAVIVHPDLKEVIPLAPEPIHKQDGTAKNDCERNAAKRLLQRIRAEHPQLGLIAIEDGLASNGPHIADLVDHKMHFILGAKPGDHASLFEAVQAAFQEDRVTVFSWEPAAGSRDVTCEIAFLNQIPLNDTHPNLLVNFLQYAEYDAEGHRIKFFTWVSDLTIDRQNAQHLVRGARSRWKIENETFNTLKNQGYNYEHNYGHGKKNLSVVFAMLMMLAFLVDQTQQLACPLFRAVWKKLKTKRSLWENLRSHFYHFVFKSMRQLYEVILYDLGKVPAPTVVPWFDTSKHKQPVDRPSMVRPPCY